MLLLWVFAIANACAFDPQFIGAGDAARSSTVKTDYSRNSASHGVGSEDSDEPCLNASDFGPNSVINVQSHAGSDPPDVLPPAVAHLTAVTPIDLVQRPIDDQRPLETAIPLRVRYVRLAL